MTTKRYLTKSRFKLGVECPTKLFYDGNKDVYADQRLEDSFLQELANGGFQVGALAKEYFPGGVEVTLKDTDEAAAETLRLLEQDEVTIFEAVFVSGKLSARVDVLRKKGNQIDIIEVKSKSFDSTEYNTFVRKDGFLVSKWVSYFEDVAFQRYVVSKALDGSSVSVSLMLADKSRSCPTDGLNQKFRVKKDNTGFCFTRVVGDVAEKDLSVPILGIVNVDEYCDRIFANDHKKVPDPVSFEEMIKQLAALYVSDKRAAPVLGAKCGKCQFKATPEEKDKGKKSGFEECWTEKLGFSGKDFDDPTVLEISYFSKKDRLLAEKRPRIVDVREDDLNIKSDGKPGISMSERQWLQVEKVRNGDNSAWFEKDAMRREFQKWTYPLHFIDFETSMAAVPFLKGQRPYEPIAFQFSHHIVEKDGSVRHAGQFLKTEPGTFPNYDFLRELKTQLETDKGTIFRYASHENTYLNHIRTQLAGDISVADRDELMAFIESITKSPSKGAKKWIGERNMVDLFELVKRFYYDPRTRGSNSIKKVLPAIMASSDYLKEKYSKPVYGTEIPSLNFADDPKAWFVEKDGQVVDPYSLLPRMFEGIDEHDYEILSMSDELGDGGAALAAYAKLQYEDMSDVERSEIKKALYRYCELDTLAMVMIYEAWREMIGSR